MSLLNWKERRFLLLSYFFRKISEDEISMYHDHKNIINICVGYIPMANTFYTSKFVEFDKKTNIYTLLFTEKKVSCIISNEFWCNVDSTFQFTVKILSKIDHRGFGFGCISNPNLDDTYRSRRWILDKKEYFPSFQFYFDLNMENRKGFNPGIYLNGQIYEQNKKNFDFKNGDVFSFILKTNKQPHKEEYYSEITFYQNGQMMSFVTLPNTKEKLKFYPCICSADKNCKLTIKYCYKHF